MSSGTNAGWTSGAATRRTVTAFFDHRADAEDAASRLQSAGVSRDSIRLMPGDERDSDESAGTPPASSLGDASVGFFESLRDLFLPDEDRHTYAEGLRRGGYLISVNATDAEYERVLDILDDEGTIDMDERADSWRAEGWSGARASDVLSGSTANLTTGSDRGSVEPPRLSGAGSAPSGTTAPISSAARDTSASRRSDQDEVIPVAEERLEVGKRDVSHGRVRVRSYVVESPVTEQVNLRQEHVDVERRPVDRPATGAEGAFQERTIDVEERSEEPVVSKATRVKEELVVKKGVEQRTETVSDTVRSTEVEVEDERRDRTGGTGTSDRRS